jgi:hypothetical protein
MVPLLDEEDWQYKYLNWVSKLDSSRQAAKYMDRNELASCETGP